MDNPTKQPEKKPRKNGEVYSEGWNQDVDDLAQMMGGNDDLRGIQVQAG